MGFNSLWRFIMPIWFRESWTTANWTHALQHPVPRIRFKYLPLWAAAVTDWLKEIKDEAINNFDKPARTCKEEICWLLQVLTANKTHNWGENSLCYWFFLHKKACNGYDKPHKSTWLRICILGSCPQLLPPKLAIHKPIFSETKWILKLR